MFSPVIKWTGSKRSSANEIVKNFPQKDYSNSVYYESFLGGASVLRTVLDSDIKFREYKCSDVNPSLISLWNWIKKYPCDVCMHYSVLWNELQSVGEDWYYKVRDDFNNVYQSPFELLFLTRTCVNGLIRYNSKGKFNSPFHFSRPGIHPNKLERIIHEWSDILNQYNVQFKCVDYTTIIPNENDIVYLDPPYFNIKENSMYYGKINYAEFIEYIERLKFDYILSLAGISDKDNTMNFPKELYMKHVYIKSGNSSFRRIFSKKKNVDVLESLYIRG